MNDPNLPTFEISFKGDAMSRVRMNGVDLRGVRHVTIDAALERPTIVTIEFMSESVTGIDDPEATK